MLSCQWERRHGIKLIIWLKNRRDVEIHLSKSRLSFGKKSSNEAWSQIMFLMMKKSWSVLNSFLLSILISRYVAPADPAALIGRSVWIRVHSDSYWRGGAAGRTYWWSDWGCHGDWEEVGGQTQQRMGEAGVGEARTEGRVVETDGCGHGYVRPLNTGNIWSSSHRNLGRLLHVLLQLLHVSLKLGSSILEPANNLKINFGEILLLCCSIEPGIVVINIIVCSISSRENLSFVKNKTKEMWERW